MPVIIATTIRFVIMAAVQLGLWTLIEKYGIPLLDKAIVATMEYWGVPEAEAKDIMANKIVKAFEEVGIFAATLKTKLPIKFAERLGFTSKGFNMRKLSPTTEAKVAKTAERVVTASNITTSEVGKIAEVVAASRGSTWSTVNNIFNITLKVLAVPVGVGLLITNTIDFGAWPSSAYQTTIQKFLAKFGLQPDAEAANSKVLSETTWDKVLNTYKQLGAVGINDPYKNQSVIFTRQTLIDLVDKVAANIIAEGGKATFQSVFGATQGFLVLSSPVTNDKITSVFGSSSGTSSGSSTSISVAPITKVFTGIVSQGVVSSGLSFTPRPDDLIESVEELRQAAANNLAPFLQSLPGKIVYEVKIVSSITTKDGFKQTGTAQRIVSGYTSSGQPKYKTVVNKFATLILYAMTDKGTRTKLSTIVLGPTDSSKLTVAQNDLRALETSLPDLVTTTDIAEIKGIETTTPITITPPASQTQATQMPASQTQATQMPANTLERSIYNSIVNTGLRGRQGVSYVYEGVEYKLDENGQLLGNGNLITKVDQTTAPAPATVPAVSATSQPGTKPGANATTLYEWYQAQGQGLPSISARAAIYAGFGLGQASYYTGTAEQNTKLLAALKAS